MRTLEEKLALPYVLCDLSCGLNFHGGKDSDWIHIDHDPADGMDIVTDWNELHKHLPEKCVNELHFSDAIEHIRTWQSDITMNQINRVIKINGIFWGTTPNRDYIFKAALQGLQNEDWIHRNLYGDGAGYGHTHYRTFTKPLLKEYLEKYGFGEVEFKPIEGWIHWTCKKLRDI